MNFFKSIISDDPDPPKPESSHESGSNSPIKPSEEDHSPNDVVEDGGGWSFGGLIKTLATRSESVIETYSRDLKEFGSGLRKESEIIKDVASRAVKELPASLEAGTSAAHGVLDGVLKSTAEIIAKEVQVFASDGEPETPETNPSLNSGRYSRFDAQLSGIQSDLNTFCEEPEDVEEYKVWKSSFKLDDKRDEIGDLIGENGGLEGVYKKVVPDAVDHETFWCRYFYRVDKLKLQEKVRANLVKRAISADEDDNELSWDFDDEEEEEEKKDDTVGEIKTTEKVKGGDEDEGNHVEIGESLNDGSQHKKEESKANVDDEVKSNPVQSSNENREGDEKEVNSNEVVEVKSEEKMKSEESVKENSSENVGVVEGEKGSMKTEEEDLGWDEIEDIGSDDEDDKKNSTSSNSERPNRAELRKQLIVAEDDEDLSWDIEDDDEPVKS
ncbi:hypothetical protein ACS0TY_012995 [Phlomoides rotata]